MLKEVLFPKIKTQPRYNEIQEQRQTIIFHTVTNDEIKNAIFTSNVKKAAGPDNINFLCLQKAYNAKSTAFHTLYKCLTNAGYQPLCWREATCAIIPKPNKIDYKTSKSYRPIVLLNCLEKIIEKIFAVRLSYYAETKNLLYKEQMGGRKQRSAIDAALRLTHEIQKARRKKLVSSCLMLDVKDVFDNVSKERLLITMKTLGIPQNVINWTNDFISNRRVTLAFDNKKDGVGR